MPDSKTKIRPQQSCLKCRERKVKCDRSIPCHACIIRGLEAECSYTATAEDRAHISQADIIERLRREVAQLRGRLNQPREPSQTKSWRQHPYAPASVSAESSSRRGGRGNDGQYSTGLETEGSWRGSSPSSSTTTMTNSVTVTSPDSTGSPCELGARSVSSRSASASAPASAPAPASASVSVSVSAYLVPTGYAPQVAEFDRSSNDAVAFGHDAIMPGYGSMVLGDMSSTVAKQVPVQGPTSDAILGMHPVYDSTMPLDGKPLPYYPQNTKYPAPLPTPTPTHFNELSISNEENQWAGVYGSAGQSQFPIQPYTSQYLSINTFANTNANINPYADVPVPTLAGDTSSRASSNSDRLSPSIMNSIPSSWKGEGKKAVLQALLETIGSCDEHQVAQVIQVVRTSPTPEEAVSGICQVLGLGMGGDSY